MIFDVQNKQKVGIHVLNPKRSIARTLCALLAMVLLACVGMPAAFAEGAAPGEISLPLVPEKTTFHFATVRTPSHTIPFAEIDSIKYFEEMSNIHIEWDEIPSASAGEKINIMLAAGTGLPDAFYGCSLSQEMIVQNGTNGILIPLEGLLAENGTYFNWLFEQRPDIKQALTAADGHIYALPCMPEQRFNYNQDQMFINKVWLDKLGLKVPETLDEFKAVLKAFKETDPNGNGKADEIPFTYQLSGGAVGSVGTLSATDIGSVFGSFGVVIYPNYLMLKDGTVEFVGASDNYREGLEWLHGLYAEGLIDEESFLGGDNQMGAKGNMEEEVLGVFMAFVRDHMLPPERVADYVVVPPLKGADGQQLWGKAKRVMINTYGAFAITKDCENPEILAKWIDWLNMPNNNLAQRFGVEGKGFEIKDGKIYNLAETVTPPAGLNYSQYVATLAPSTNPPFIFTKEWLENYVQPPMAQAKLEATKDVYEPFMDPEPLPEFGLLMSSSVRKELATLQIDIVNQANQMKAEFIRNGVTDAAWDSYVQTLNQMDVARYVEIFQKMYDENYK